MSRDTLGEARQAIVLGLGQTGRKVISCLERRLAQRHGGIPTIRLIALDAGHGSTVPFTDHGGIQSLDLSIEVEGLEARSKEIERWLPEEAAGLTQRGDELTETRLWGRLALFWHGLLVYQRLRNAANMMLSVATQSELVPKGLRVQDESSLDIYVVADLVEPFASGAFIDLTYLALYSVLGQEVGSVFPQTTGLLFLPGFRTYEDASAPSQNEILVRHNAEIIRDADAYAALKELDHYMDQRRYEAAYSPALTFPMRVQPFTRSCYLIDAVNERNKGMPRLEQMTEMVGEWLYQMLVSPMKDSFREEGVRFSDVRSHGKVATYSSLGLASYYLPIEDVIDANAVRLSYELVERCFLSSASVDQELPASDLGGQPQEVQERLRDDLAWDVKREAYFYVPPRYFSDVAPHDLGRLEGQIRRTFGFRLRQTLPLLRRGMDSNLAAMLTEFEARLAERTALIVDAAPVSGLSLARRFLHSLKGDLAAEEKRARSDLERQHSELRELENRTRQDRANHTASVQTFGSIPALAALSAWVLVFVTLVYYSASTILDRLPLIPVDFGQSLMIAAAIVSVGGVLSLAAAAYVGWDWWDRTRDAYVDDYRLSLNHALECDLRRFESRYYSQAQEAVERQLDELVRFQDCLEDVRDELLVRLDAPRMMYGSPRFVIEESVIDEGDVRAFYSEVIGNPLDREILSLSRQHGALYSWRDASCERIIEMLLAYSCQRFAVLRRTKTAEDLLLQHAIQDAPEPTNRVGGVRTSNGSDSSESKRRLRRRLEKLVDNSMPFLRFRNLELEPGVSTRLIHRVGFEGAQNENSRIYQVLEEQGIAKHLTDDRHRVVSMSVRHGIPLAAMGLPRRWRTEYESLRSRAERPLHTRRSHLALPDIFPIGEDVLQPQMAVALGIAYRRLKRRDDDGHYVFRYQDDLGETVQADLGERKIDACVALQDSPVVLKILSERVDEETIRRSEQLDKAGRKRGNRAVTGYLHRYKRRVNRAGELEDWEEAMIDEYISRLER